MKNYKLLLSALAAGAMMVLASKAAAADEMGYMTVVRASGDATYSVDGGHTWAMMVTGKHLAPGTIMKTGPAAMVDLLVGKTYADKQAGNLQFNTSKNPAGNIMPENEKNMIRLRPNSVMSVDKLMVPEDNHYKVSDTELDLKQGDIFASVQKVSPSSQYLIKLPNGVAAVRGTTFALGAGQRGGHGVGGHCGVATGTVWLTISVTDANGNPVTQPDGQPFPPVPITLNQGQNLTLTVAVLQAFATVMAQASDDIKAIQAANPNASTATIQGLIDAKVTAALQTVENAAGSAIAQVSPALAAEIAVAVAATSSPVSVTVTTTFVTTGGKAPSQ